VAFIYVVSGGAELPEGLDEEPGALVSRPVQSDAHGVLLQQSRQPFVHRQVFVALHVEQLHTDTMILNVIIYGLMAHGGVKDRLNRNI